MRFQQRRERGGAVQRWVTGGRLAGGQEVGRRRSEAGPSNVTRMRRWARLAAVIAHDPVVVVAH